MSKTKRNSGTVSIRDEAQQCAKELKDEIKKLYIGYKNSTQLNEDYEKAFQTIKNEYEILYQKYEAVNKKLNEIENKNKKKRARYESDYEDDNIQYVVRKKKKPKIIYVDDENDDQEQMEEMKDKRYEKDEKEENEKEFENKLKSQTKNKNEIDIMQKTRKNNKKGISRAIKF